MSRLFALFLVLTLLVPAGTGRLDLCGCEGSGHGVLCGQAKPQPAQARSCCAQRPDTQRPDTQVSPSSEEPCPGCPELDLGHERLTGVFVAQDSPEPDQLLALGPLPREPLPFGQGARIAPQQWARPPPGPHRLHLLQQVFLR